MGPWSIITLLTQTLYSQHWLCRSWFPASSVNTLSRLFQARARPGKQRSGYLLSLCANPCLCSRQYLNIKLLYLIIVFLKHLFLARTITFICRIHRIQNVFIFKHKTLKATMLLLTEWKKNYLIFFLIFKLLSRVLHELWKASTSLIYKTEKHQKINSPGIKLFRGIIFL